MNVLIVFALIATGVLAAPQGEVPQEPDVENTTPAVTEITPAAVQELQGESCMCTQQHVPICGSDGKAYDNPCLAECAGISTYTPGSCLEATTGKAKREVPAGAGRTDNCVQVPSTTPDYHIHP